MEHAVSYSEIKWWRFCHHAHFLKYQQRIVPKVSSRPLQLGSIIHELLELYAQGQSWELRVQELEKEYSKFFLEERELYGDIPSLARAIMEGYTTTYKDDDLRVLGVEIELPKVKLSKHMSFKGRVDRVIMQDQRVFLGETKTGRSLPGEDFREWDIQTLLYIWALEKARLFKFDGIMWDHIRTKTPTIPRVLKNGQLSQAKNIDTTYEVYMQAIAEQGLNPADYSEILDILAMKKNQFYRRVFVPIPRHFVPLVVHDAKLSANEIYRAKVHPEKASSKLRSMSNKTCPNCMYSKICHAAMQGADVEFIIQEDYMPKPPHHQEEENEPEDRESGED